MTELCERVDRQLVENGWDPFPEFPSLTARSLLKRQHAIRNKLTDLESRMTALETNNKKVEAEVVEGWSANEIRLLHDTFSVELGEDGQVRSARGIVKVSPTVHRISISPSLGIKLFGHATYKQLVDTARRTELIKLAKDRLQSTSTEKLQQLLFPPPPPPPPPPPHRSLNDGMDRKHRASSDRAHHGSEMSWCGESCFVCERCDRCCFECNCLECDCSVCTIVNHLIQLKLPNAPAPAPAPPPLQPSPPPAPQPVEDGIWRVQTDGREIRCGPVAADLRDFEWLKNYLLNGCRMFIPQLDVAVCEIEIVSSEQRLARLSLRPPPPPPPTPIPPRMPTVEATEPCQMVLVYIDDGGSGVATVRVLPEQLGADSIVSATLLANDLSNRSQLYEVQRHSYHTCTGDCIICNLVWSSPEFSRLSPFHIYTCRPQLVVVRSI